MYRLFERIAERSAQAMALAGGAVLIAMTAMTVVSIVGRSLNRFGLGPVPGDFELIEVGAAFAIFAFLPWCQLKRGHVTVDLFLARFSAKANYGIDIAANLLMTLAAAIMLWRLTLGMLDKHAYGETSFILQFPAWWGYAGAMAGAILFALVCAFTVWRSIREFAQASNGANNNEARA